MKIVIDSIILLFYIFIARMILRHMRSHLLRRFSGIAMGSVLIALISVEIIPFTPISFLIAFPGSIYLAMLPDWITSKNK